MERSHGELALFRQVESEALETKAHLSRSFSLKILSHINKTISSVDETQKRRAGVFLAGVTVASLPILLRSFELPVDAGIISTITLNTLGGILVGDKLKVVTSAIAGWRKRRVMDRISAQDQDAPVDITEPLQWSSDPISRKELKNWISGRVSEEWIGDERYDVIVALYEKRAEQLKKLENGQRKQAKIQLTSEFFQDVARQQIVAQRQLRQSYHPVIKLAQKLSDLGMGVSLAFAAGEGLSMLLGNTDAMPFASLLDDIPVLGSIYFSHYLQPISRLFSTRDTKVNVAQIVEMTRPHKHRVNVAATGHQVPPHPRTNPRRE